MLTVVWSVFERTMFWMEPAFTLFSYENFFFSSRLENFISSMLHSSISVVCAFFIGFPIAIFIRRRVKKVRAIAAREALPTEVRWTLGASHGVSYVSWRTFALGTVMASPLSWFSSAIVAGWSDRRADRSAGRTRRVAQKAKSHFFHCRTDAATRRHARDFGASRKEFHYNFLIGCSAS